MRMKTTYLQMFARPERVVPPPREGLVVVHAKKPTVAYYRFLYDAVGRDYDWTSRKKLSDAELAALLNDPRLGKPMKILATGTIGLQSEYGLFEFRRIRIQERP